MWCLVAALFALGACGAAMHGRAEPDVVFTKYSSLSRPGEVARRALPPIAYRRIEEDLAAKRQRLADQAIDLANEKFDLYVPSAQPPPGGYGLLVYVAPWGEPTRPKDWYSALESHRLIFVAAQESGNDRNVLDRRIPLALLAYENVRARFPINSERVFIAGFSGGSRVAGMVALAYPDVFRGVIMNAGSDTIDGSAHGEGNFKPPAELFRAFQRSRLVYVTGEEDPDHVQQDRTSRESMRDSCVLDIRDVLEPRVAHRAVDGAVLDRALDALEAPGAIDADELARCNERVESKLTAELAKVSAAISRGDRDGARAQLMAIDARYGGLAAPRSLELYARLTALK
jgi:hypothetical protein